MGQASGIGYRSKLQEQAGGACEEKLMRKHEYEYECRTSGVNHLCPAISPRSLGCLFPPTSNVRACLRCLRLLV